MFLRESGARVFGDESFQVERKRSLSFWVQDFSIFIPLLSVHLKN